MKYARWYENVTLGQFFLYNITYLHSISFLVYGVFKLSIKILNGVTVCTKIFHLYSTLVTNSFGVIVNKTLS